MKSLLTDMGVRELGVSTASQQLVQLYQPERQPVTVSKHLRHLAYLRSAVVTGAAVHDFPVMALPGADSDAAVPVFLPASKLHFSSATEKDVLGELLDAGLSFVHPRVCTHSVTALQFTC
jgi:hypothetical protein